MFDGQLATPQTINLLYNGLHHHVIMKLTAAKAKRYIWPACNKGWERGAQHRCDAPCDACSVILPYIQDNVMIPCDDCSRHFSNAVGFKNHKRLKISGKNLCEAKRRCRRCGAMEGRNHEFYKRFCSNYIKNRQPGHKCYTAPLSYKALRSRRVLIIFYDFETTQNMRCTYTAFEHVPNLVCVQHFCAVCEDDADVEVDFKLCRMTKQFLDR